MHPKQKTKNMWTILEQLNVIGRKNNPHMGGIDSLETICRRNVETQSASLRIDCWGRPIAFEDVGRPLFVDGPNRKKKHSCWSDAQVWFFFGTS